MPRSRKVDELTLNAEHTEIAENFEGCLSAGSAVTAFK
jgi:hypothetical protein